MAHFKAFASDSEEGMAKVSLELKEMGFKLSDFEARLFGGGEIRRRPPVAKYKRDRPRPDGPQENGQKAVKAINDFLVRENIPLLETDLYGEYDENDPNGNVRCIMMNLENGKVCDYPYEENAIKVDNCPILNEDLPLREGVVDHWRQQMRDIELSRAELEASLLLRG